MANASQMLTTPQAAEHLGGLKPNTLEGWRIQGTGPRYCKVGRLVRYRIEDLDAYLNTHTRQSTSQDAIPTVATRQSFQVRGGK